MTCLLKKDIQKNAAAFLMVIMLAETLLPLHIMANTGYHPPARVISNTLRPLPYGLPSFSGNGFELPPLPVSAENTKQADKSVMPGAKKQKPFIGAQGAARNEQL